MNRQLLLVATTLALIAVIGAGLLAATKRVTEPAIEAELRADRLSQLRTLIPIDQHDNQLLEDTIQIQDPTYLGTPEPVTVYRARQGGEPVGVAFEIMAPDGYNGAIKLLVAIWADGTLAGVRAVKHSETPGLGDRIETAKSDWIRQFEGHSLTSPPIENWAVKKDGGVFDRMTGATITSRAVIKAVRRALKLYQLRGREAFFKKSKPEGTSDHKAPKEELN